MTTKIKRGLWPFGDESILKNGSLTFIAPAFLFFGKKEFIIIDSETQSEIKVSREVNVWNSATNTFENSQWPITVGTLTGDGSLRYGSMSVERAS